VADVVDVDIVLCRDTIKRHSQVRKVPSHFMSVNDTTVDSLDLIPLHFVQGSSYPLEPGAQSEEGSMQRESESQGNDTHAMHVKPTVVAGADATNVISRPPCLSGTC
jgi:hypothetical protein